MASKVYDQAGGIFYEVIEELQKIDDHGSFGNSVSDKDREAVREYFPFSEGAPAWSIAVLKEFNNINHMKELIGNFNTGGDNFLGKLVHENMVSNLVI